MGVSTNGILFYGIAYGEGLQLDEIAKSHGLSEDYFDGDFETLYATKMGVPPPTEEYSSAVTDKYHAYWDAKREIVTQGGCEVGTYCSDDYPMYFVSVKAGKYVVRRGSEVEIPDGLHAESTWAQQLKDFCDLMHLPYQEPKWLLVSYWS